MEGYSRLTFKAVRYNPGQTGFWFRLVLCYRPLSVGTPKSWDNKKPLLALFGLSELLMTSGIGKFAILAWREKIEPVNGLRLLSNGRKRFAILACRGKANLSNGLRSLKSGIGQFAMRGAPGTSALVPVFPLISKGNGQVAMRPWRGMAEWS